MPHTSPAIDASVSRHDAVAAKDNEAAETVTEADDATDRLFSSDAVAADIETVAVSPSVGLVTEADAVCAAAGAVCVSSAEAVATLRDSEADWRCVVVGDTPSPSYDNEAVGGPNESEAVAAPVAESVGLPTLAVLELYGRERETERLASSDSDSCGSGVVVHCG